MKKLFLKITVIVVLFLIPKIVFGNVVINEVLYDPQNDDIGKEYVILYNNGDTAFDLTGYELNAVAGDYYIFPLFSLNAKSSIVIHWRKDGINSLTNLYTGTSGFDDNMGNTSGYAAFFKSHPTTGTAKDLIIDYVEYGAGSKTWETAAVDAGLWTTGQFITDVPEGKAIKLKVDGVDNNSPNDWVESEPSIIQEEPETPTETTTSSSGVAVNQPPVADARNNIIGFVNQELTFDGTKSSDPNRDELHYEWNMGNGKLIEMPSFTYMYPYPGTYLVTLMVFDGKKYASDTITVQIQQAQITINEFMANSENKDEKTGWIEIYNDADMIMDISGWQLDDAASGSAPFVFPKNTFIAPKSYLTFSQQITNIDLNNDKDSVRLLLPSGTVFQEINYENPLQNKSSARTAEGFVWSEPTPGIANISGLAIKNSKQTVLQMNSVKPQTVKNSSGNYIVSLPDNEIKGGYVTINPNDKEPNTQTNDLAAINQPATQNPLNLIFVFVAVIFGSGFIGLLLVKFRKKRPAPSVPASPVGGVEGLPI